MEQRPKAACSRLTKSLKLEHALQRLSVREQLPNPTSPTPAGVGSQGLLQRCPMVPLGMLRLVCLAEVLPECLLSNLQSTLPVPPPDYVHHAMSLTLQFWPNFCYILSDQMQSESSTIQLNSMELSAIACCSLCCPLVTIYWQFGKSTT